jgi:murein tripeptide amidase MpaA
VQAVRPGSIDVRVTNAKDRELVSRLTTSCEVVVEDLELATQNAEAENIASRARPGADWFDNYHTLSEIVPWYQQLAASNPNFMTFYDRVGSSHEGRNIFGLRLFDNSTGRAPQRAFFWTGQIHAREWISGATVQYLVNQIITQFNTGDPDIHNIFANHALFVLPCVNPDGYEFTWTNDRQWRKNRRVNGVCIGVDQNRNYDDHWNGGGSSPNPCSDTYMGPSAASEPEVQAVQTFFQSVQKDSPIVGAIDWHSYSQLVLRPYGWTNATSPDEAVLKQLGDGYAADILKESGKVYTSQPSIDLYVTSGTASDWYYGNGSRTNGPYKAAGYTVELRPLDAAGGGFQLPPREIVPTGNENWVAIKNWLQYLASNPISQ